MAKETKKTSSVAAVSADSGAKKSAGDSLYALEEFVANPDVLEACADVVSAALTEKGVKEATIEEAKKIVKEFKERKVQ